MIKITLIIIRDFNEKTHPAFPTAPNGLPWFKTATINVRCKITKWGSLVGGRESSSPLFPYIMHWRYIRIMPYNSQPSPDTCYPFVPSNNILPITRVWCRSLGWHIARARTCARVCVCVFMCVRRICVRRTMGNQESFFRVRGYE